MTKMIRCPACKRVLKGRQQERADGYNFAGAPRYWYLLPPHKHRGIPDGLCHGGGLRLPD